LTVEDARITFRVAEDGTTYAENAARKALQYCRASGLLTLADDSGLEVDALDGAPGLHSARYSAKPGANDADRRMALLQNLQCKPKPWTARFRCTVVVAVPAGHPLPGGFTPAAVIDGISLYQTEGTCEGEIIEQERGRNGFGYDPIFLMAGMVYTMAELSTEEKNQLSHRAQAVKAAMPLLESLSAGLI
jgi:XTP/dITP diphosphohydrolase